MANEQILSSKDASSFLNSELSANTGDADLARSSTPYLQHKKMHQESVCNSTTSDSNKSFSSENFSNQFNEIVAEIREKRENDTRDSQEFRDKMFQWAEEFTRRMNSNRFAMYHSKSIAMNKKLEEIAQEIGRVQQLENEIHEFKSLIGSLYKEAEIRPPLTASTPQRSDALSTLSISTTASPSNTTFTTVSALQPPTTSSSQ